VSQKDIRCTEKLETKSSQLICEKRSKHGGYQRENDASLAACKFLRCKAEVTVAAHPARHSLLSREPSERAELCPFCRSVRSNFYVVSISTENPTRPPSCKIDRIHFYGRHLQRICETKPTANTFIESKLFRLNSVRDKDCIEEEGSISTEDDVATV
jgi:hypothetical protein